MKMLQKDYEIQYEEIRTKFNSSFQSCICGNPQYQIVAQNTLKTITNIFSELKKYKNSVEVSEATAILYGTYQILKVLQDERNKDTPIINKGPYFFAILNPIEEKFGSHEQKLGFLDGLNMRLNITMPFLKETKLELTDELAKLFNELEKNLGLVWQKCENLIIQQLISDTMLQDQIMKLKNTSLFLEVWDVPLKDKAKIDQLTNFTQRILTALNNKKKPEEETIIEISQFKLNIKLFTPQTIMYYYSIIKPIVGLCSNLQCTTEKKSPQGHSFLVACSLTTQKKKKKKKKKKNNVAATAPSFTAAPSS